MSSIEQPKSAEIRALTRAEIDVILCRNNAGRLAFSVHDRVDIEPINYVYKDNWIYGRTSTGSKLDILTRHAWAAFEVDEIAALFDWRSVVVKGGFSIVGPQASNDLGPTDTSGRQNPAFVQAVELLRALLPDTMLATDPTPFRHTMFRIHLDEVSGREATPSGPSTNR